MIVKSRGARRVAALASSALVAGALTLLPAGFSSASAEAVNLGYTCTVSGFGAPQSVDSSLQIEMTAPASVKGGTEFTADVTYTLDMSPAAMGPVNPVAGGVKFDFTVGSQATQATIPATNWTPADGGLKRVGTGTVTLLAPATAGNAAIKVVNVALAGTASVGASTVPFNPPCTPDAEQNQTIASTAVTPGGLGYTCVVSGFGAPQNVDSGLTIHLDTPDTVKAGATFDVPVTYTLDMSGAAMGPVNPVAGGVKFDFTVGSQATQVTIPASNWTPADGGLKRVGTGTATLTAPGTVGNAPIKVNNVALAGTASVGATTVPFNPACTPDAEQDQTVDTIAVTPDGLGYTCVVSGFGAPQNVDSGLVIELTAPETVTAGEDFTADVTYKLDISGAAMGPVNPVAGGVKFDFTVGDAATQATIPATNWTPADGGLKRVGSGTVTLTAPEDAGDADIEVGNVALAGTASVGATTVPFNPACTADAEQDQKIASTSVEAAPVIPAGLEYSCTWTTYTFPAYIDTMFTDLPESVDEGDELNPELTSTVTWIEDADPSWAVSSRNIEALYRNTTGALDTSAGDAAGSLVFDSTPVPTEGDMVWTATGSYGDVDTSTPGSTDLEVGDVLLSMETANKFTNGNYTPTTIPCVLVEGQDAVLGTVDINDVPDVTVATAPKVTGSPKVGQKLTASAGFTPADATTSYQWLRNGAAIAGATAATYTATPADLGKTISVRVTGAKDGFMPATATASAGKIAAGVQKVTGKVKASGTAKVGKKLTAVPGKATGAKVTYQWLVNGKAVKGATGKTMKLAKSLKGKKISVKAIYTRAGYTTITQTSSALKVK
jgi:hypothetical protein